MWASNLCVVLEGVYNVSNNSVKFYAKWLQASNRCRDVPCCAQHRKSRNRCYSPLISSENNSFDTISLKKGISQSYKISRGEPWLHLGQLKNNFKICYRCNLHNTSKSVSMKPKIWDINTQHSTQDCFCKTNNFFFKVCSFNFTCT